MTTIIDNGLVVFVMSIQAFCLIATVGRSIWSCVLFQAITSGYRNQQCTNSPTRYTTHLPGVILVTERSVTAMLRGDLTKSCSQTVGSKLLTTKLTRTATTPASVTKRPGTLPLYALVAHTKHGNTSSLFRSLQFLCH